MKSLKKLSFVAMLCLGLAACKKDNEVAPELTVKKLSLQSSALATTNTLEDFESGSKTAYTTGSVTLSTGSWTFNDALIGDLTADAKVGTKSARIRNSGSLTMNFDVTDASSVSISHAVYGSDAGSTWQLLYSTDGGTSWQQTGSTVSSNTTTLNTVTFNTNLSGNVRFQIRKISGGTARINIDNISITSGGGTTPTDPSNPPAASTGDNSNLLMGNPSNALMSITSDNNYLMDQTYYAESYNRTQGKPNWVSWHLGASDLGSVGRTDNFRADTNLPSSWYAVSNTSYSGSGFDRGHNCPSGDRTSATTANSATFLMTNMMPQAPNNNQVTWANLENYTRSLVTAGSEAYIICGSYGTGGTGSNGGLTNTIDNGRITVPARTWKVIVILSNGSGDLSRVNNATRVIAVDMPNTNGLNSDWKAYRTNVDAIEAATGYDILSNVPTAIQSTIEAKVDNQ